jgi:hypothetical protein
LSSHTKYLPKLKVMTLSVGEIPRFLLILTISSIWFPETGVHRWGLVWGKEACCERSYKILQSLCCNHHQQVRLAMMTTDGKTLLCLLRMYGYPTFSNKIIDNQILDWHGLPSLKKKYSDIHIGS